MIIKLQRCPFCGSLAGYSKIPQQGFTVVCRGCGAIAMHEWAAGRDEIARSWNQRTTRVAFSSSAIKPCPFCGGQIPQGARGPIIRCPSCGMMVSFALGDSVGQAAELWNRRAKVQEV